MTEYRFGRPQDEEDILDLCNYVFSHSSRPHDFQKMLPKIYMKPNFAPLHALAWEEGRLRGVAGVLPLDLRLGGSHGLQVGYVGQVAVHPYWRGHGYMKELMRMQEERCRSQGLDLMALGGQRQRYNHFGFENAGANLSFEINQSNLRYLATPPGALGLRLTPLAQAGQKAVDTAYAMHAGQAMAVRRAREDFVSILSSWDALGYAVMQGDHCLGYVYGQRDIYEWALEDAALLAEVLHAWFILRGLPGANVHVPGHDEQRLRAAAAIAQGFRITSSCMVYVLNWPKVLTELLDFKRRHWPLQEGETVLEIQGQGRYLLRVDSAASAVLPTARSAQMVLSPLAAQSLLLSPAEALYQKTAVFYNWLPLPLHIPMADGF